MKQTRRRTPLPPHLVLRKMPALAKKVDKEDVLYNVGSINGNSGGAVRTVADNMKGRVYEANLADLDSNNTKDQPFKNHRIADRTRDRQ